MCHAFLAVAFGDTMEGYRQQLTGVLSHMREGLKMDMSEAAEQVRMLVVCLCLWMHDCSCPWWTALPHECVCACSVCTIAPMRNTTSAQSKGKFTHTQMKAPGSAAARKLPTMPIMPLMPSEMLRKVRVCVGVG